MTVAVNQGVHGICYSVYDDPRPVLVGCIESHSEVYRLLCTDGVIECHFDLRCMFPKKTISVREAVIHLRLEI